MKEHKLDPSFAADLRALLIEHVTLEAAATKKARVRRRLFLGAGAAVAIGIAGGTAVAITNLLPGSDQVTTYGNPTGGEFTGTSTLDLGSRPAGATSVSIEFTCLSPGAFTFPDGAAETCDENTMERPATYRMTLPSGQHAITITATPGARWKINASYSSAVATAWGVNARGETFGVENEKGTPDLIAVIATNGKQGYAYARDMAAVTGVGPTSPEDAASLSAANAGKTMTVPVYESDGTTLLGQFTIGPAVADTTP